MDNNVVDIINVCVHTWLLILVVCFLTLSEIAFLCVCVYVFSVSHLKGKIIFQVISSKAWRSYCILLNIVDLLKDQTCWIFTSKMYKYFWTATKTSLAVWICITCGVRIIRIDWVEKFVQLQNYLALRWLFSSFCLPFPYSILFSVLKSNFLWKRK